MTDRGRLDDGRPPNGAVGRKRCRKHVWFRHGDSGEIVTCLRCCWRVLVAARSTTAATTHGMTVEPTDDRP